MFKKSIVNTEIIQIIFKIFLKFFNFSIFLLNIKKKIFLIFLK